MIKTLANIFAKVVITLALLAFTGNMVIAQQQRIYNYNQFADELTPVNAAYSLLDGANSVSLRGNKQLIGIDGAPTSFMMSGSFRLDNINGAVGAYVLNEHIAVENQTEFNAFFAKAVQLTPKTYLSVAINGGIRNYTADYSKLDSYDPQFSSDIRQTKPNVGFAVMMYGSDYYLGLSVPQLTTLNLGTASIQDQNYLRSHYYFTGAYLAVLSEDVKFKPATLLLYTPSSPVIANLSGMLYLKDQLGLGMNYRTDKTVAAMLSVLTKTLRIGYSYQFGVSGTPSGVNTVTHELGIAYRFGNTANSKLL